MITVRDENNLLNETITIPNLTNADAYVNERSRVILQMNNGYVFWDKKMYYVNGEYVEPSAEDICYSKWASMSPTRDFSLLMEAVESEVPADQIFGTGDKPVTE